MKIGIDIDDTTFLTFNSMLKYADKYNKEIGGIYQNNGNYGLIKNRYYLQSLYGWDNKVKEDFFNKYYKSVLKDCTPLPNACDIINKIKSDGHVIHFITARIDRIENCDAKKITMDSLAKYHIDYDYLSLGINDKVTFCMENNIDLMIEDSYETCRELTNKGIKALLMTTVLNENILDNEITRVTNWNEVYDEITKMNMVGDL